MEASIINLLGAFYISLTSGNIVFEVLALFLETRITLIKQSVDSIESLVFYFESVKHRDLLRAAFYKIDNFTNEMIKATDKKNFQIRPRFITETSHSVEKIDLIIKDRTRSLNAPFSGKSTIGYFSFYPHKKDHHYWSPHLSVIVEDREYGSLLRGHYGPSPAVWTMFVFLYVVIGLGAVILTIIGFANLSIGLSGDVLWIVPLLLTTFASLYYASFIGQKKGHDQIESIHLYLEKCIDQEIK